MPSDLAVQPSFPPFSGSRICDFASPDYSGFAVVRILSIVKIRVFYFLLLLRKISQSKGEARADIKVL